LKPIERVTIPQGNIDPSDRQTSHPEPVKGSNHWIPIYLLFEAFPEKANKFCNFNVLSYVIWLLPWLTISMAKETAD
jgi:hypothetical protein